MHAVRTARTQTCQSDAIAPSGVASPRPSIGELDRQRPEQGQRRPPSPAMRLLEDVVGAGPDGWRRADRDDGQHQGDGDGQRQRGGRDDLGVPDAGHGGRAGERPQPRGAGDRAAGMDAPDVVHLRDAPADPQRPARRASAGQSVEGVEHHLVAHDHGDGHVDERQIGERGQRAAVGETPVVAAHVDDEHGGVDGQHAEQQPAVGAGARRGERRLVAGRDAAGRQRPAGRGLELGGDGHRQPYAARPAFGSPRGDQRARVSAMPIVVPNTRWALRSFHSVAMS